MITSFKSLGQNGGGGGSGYTLPVASQSTLGGVKIGNGIDIDSGGTISVTGGTGGGIEVVTELPASGTDGQMVLLETVIPEKHIHITGMGTASNNTQSVTAIGITTKTKLFDYNAWSSICPVYVNADGTYSIYDPILEQENSYPVGETTVHSIVKEGSGTLTITGTVTTTGCTFKIDPAGTWRQNAIDDIDQIAEETQVLYTWSDTQELVSDIDYTSNGGASTNWVFRFKGSEIPTGATLVVLKAGSSWNNYAHIVYENGELHSYQSDSADTYTATTYENIAQYGYVDVTMGTRNTCRIYWTDDEIVGYSTSTGIRQSINVNAFYRSGWHRNIEHRNSNKAFYRDYTWFDEDYGIILKNPAYTLSLVDYYVNRQGQYSSQGKYQLYSFFNSATAPSFSIFAPTTTGTTGQVCVAGNGWAAPTWTNPETLTNGVKFWKGTQDEYDALSGTGYDSSTLYIIAD